MRTRYRDPQVEEGVHNVVLQNRCGNRLSVLCHEAHTELEFTYKPNAFRRKDFYARNFSNRDNQTTLFRSCTWPDLGAGMFVEFAYDPFLSRFHILSPSQARNTITIVNLADENAFALSARQPLLLALRPHSAFEAQDGLLTERFEDRGEGIMSFIAFPGYEANRYRVLDDGTHILQLLENDVVLMGAEETPSEVSRLLTALRGYSLDALVERNEALLAPPLKKGRVRVEEDDFQEVLDLNRRVAFSGLDAGGACFGALNRIYYLIWVRDGSMTACHMALSGNPDFLRIWAPFLLANPTERRLDDGQTVREFAQMVGTRWTKAEDDGLFYAMWTAFAHVRTTGDESLLRGPGLPLLLDCVDAHLEKCWEPALGLMGSDTLGEDPLPSNPYYGYDIVNGSMSGSVHSAQEGRPRIRRCHSLYHQVNTYNVLTMACCLLDACAEPDGRRQDRYRQLAERIRLSLRSAFVDADGRLQSLHFTYDDGTEGWLGIEKGMDYWEHGWAVSQGPFFPVPDLQFASCREHAEKWESIAGAYGFCPWNVMARSLFDHGMSSEEQRAMLQREVDEARMQADKYPLRGALTEYSGRPDGWRGLPFSAGSFLLAHAGLLLSPLPMGLAVRGGARASGLDNFQYRSSEIGVRAAGVGDGVASYGVAGQTFRSCLQLADSVLRPGPVSVVIERGRPSCPQLHASDAELIEVEERDDTLRAVFASPLPKQFWIRGFAEATVRVEADDECELQGEVTVLPGSDLTLLRVDHCGRVRMVMQWG